MSNELRNWAKARRIGATGKTSLGLVRQGQIYDIPTEWLTQGGWEQQDGPQRFTEPAGKLPVADAPPELTNAQLKEQLDALGVKYAANINKAGLLELLAAAEAPAGEAGEQTDNETDDGEKPAGEGSEPEQEDGNAGE